MSHSVRFYSCACLLVLPLASPVAAQPAGTSSDAAGALFLYEDIERFIPVFESLGTDTDTLETLQSEYLERGSPGLLMFIEKYDLTPERLRGAIRSFPDDYARLGAVLQQLKGQEPAFREAYASMKRLMPDAVFLPTYFLVGAHRGIGSGSVEGPLVSIEKYLPDAVASGDILPMLVHEMTHIQQVIAIGYDKYLAIYGEEKSLLAVTIREGIAEYVADRVTGQMTQQEAREFVAEHESALWMAFQDDMLGSETGDWMWRTPNDPEQPPHVAYVLGARITESYYENAADKEQAMREILSVTDYPAFLKKSGYNPE